MSERRKLRVIEVKDGRLPPGVSSKDLTGPIVLMEDGKLPPGLSEDRLIEIGATVLAVKSGETFPCIITQTQKRQYLQWGISEEKLKEAGFIVVDNDVIDRGRVETERVIAEKAKALSEEAMLQLLTRIKGEIKEFEERLAALQQLKGYLEKLLSEKSNIQEKGGS